MMTLLKRQTVPSSSVGVEFSETLRKHDIRRFTPESVTKYQQKMIREDTPFLRRHFSRDTLLWTHCAAMVLAVILMAASAATLMNKLFWNEEFLYHVPYWASIWSLGTAIAIFGFGAPYLRGLSTWQMAYWNLIPVADYIRVIPEFADQTIKDLAICPGTKFSIEEFSKGFDPFLVVEYRGQKHYVEVWNEPGYDQKRQA